MLECLGDAHGDAIVHRADGAVREGFIADAQRHAARDGDGDELAGGQGGKARDGDVHVDQHRAQESASLGAPTGVVTGTGALTLDVGDFPHAWYLRQVLQKVEQEWQRQNQPAEPPQKPQIYVEIQRDGSIGAPAIHKSSGNAFYDNAALRAVMAASPFPKLPDDWTKPTLRILFTFDLRRG